jgi:hypothetical protein
VPWWTGEPYGRALRGRADPCGRPTSGHEVALRLQLVEAVDHHAARDAQPSGELSGGRQLLVCPQPARANRVSQPTLQLGTQGLTGASV